MVEYPLPKAGRHTLGQAVEASVATAFLLTGWLILDTLIIDLGPVRHTAKFFDLWAVIADPTGVLLRGDNRHLLSSALFGVICCATALAPLLTRTFPPRFARAAWFAPLTVLLVTAAVLYLRLPGELLHTPDTSGPVRRDLIRLANDLLGRGVTFAMRRLTVGGGAYVAGFASLWLATIGIRRWRR
jgi:hypothetical protein